MKYEHLYFHENENQNPNEIQKTSFWKRFCDAFNSKFTRDLQYGVQLTTALVIAAIIGYISDYKNDVAIGWILPVTSALLIFDTFGNTVFGLIGGVFSFLPVSIFLYIVQILGVGYHNYTSATLIFFFATFYLGYTNSSVASRKVALLLPVIMIPTLINTPRQYVSRNFIWNLVGETFMALCISVAVSLVVFPRFAGVELQDRFSYSLNKISKVFELTILAIMSTTKVESENYIMEAELLLRLLYENQDHMAKRNMFSKVEPQFLLRKIFRYYQPLYLQYDPQELLGISSSLLWHSYSMIHAAKEMNFHGIHAEVVQETKQTFILIAKRFQQIVQLIEKVHSLHGTERDEIDSAMNTLLEACDEAYKVLSLATRHIDTQKLLLKEEMEVKNLRTEFSTFLQRLKTGETELDSSNFPQDSTASINLDDFPSYDIDAKLGSNRLIFSFFLFHLSEMVQCVHSKFHSVSIEKMKKDLEEQEKKKKKKQNESNDGKSKVTLLERLKMIVISIGQAIYNYHFENWHEKLKMGIRTAFVMGVALIFIEVPILADKFENGQWIMLAMLNSQGDNLGGNISQMRLRLLGTMLGSIYSYFIYVAITNNNPRNEFLLTDEQTFYYVLAMMVPFAIVCGMIKQNKEWSYFGSISITTSLIVTFGRIPYLSPPPANYSLLRIQQNAVGIALLFCCSLITIPVLANDELKLNLISIVKIFKSAQSKLWKNYQKELIKNKQINLTTHDNQEQSSTSAAVIPDQETIRDIYQQNELVEVRELEMAAAENTIHPDLFEDNQLNPTSPKKTLSEFEMINFSNKNPSNEREEQRKSELLPSTNHQDHHDSSTSINNNIIISHDKMLKEVYQIYLSQNLQFLNYILTENLLFYQKLQQQKLLFEQSNFESYFLSFFAQRNSLFSSQSSLHLMDELLLLEVELIQLLKTFDRILVRIKLFLQLEVFPQTMMIIFITKFSSSLNELFELIDLLFQGMVIHLESSLYISDDLLVLRKFQSNFLKLFSDKKNTQNKPTEQPDENPSKPKKNNNDNNSSNQQNKNHLQRKNLSNQQIIIQKLSLLSKRLYFLSHEFNHLLFTSWFSDLLVKSGLMIPQTYDFTNPQQEIMQEIEIENWLSKEVYSQPKQQQQQQQKKKQVYPSEIHEKEEGEDEKIEDLEQQATAAATASSSRKKIMQITSGMVIHRLFDILTAFNGLFYTSTHLARTTIKLSNLLIRMVEMEKDDHHKPF